MQTMQLAAVS